MHKSIPLLALLTAFIVAGNVDLQPAAARGSKSSTGASQSKDDPGCRSCVSQAASMFAARRTTDAANLLKEWQARCPRNAQLHLLLSTVLLRMGGQTEAAIAAAQRATQAAPDSVAAHLQLGLLQSAAENYLKAAQAFERVVELDPGNYEAWSSLSGAYANLHEDEKAQKCAAKAADLEPGTRSVRLKTLRNLANAGKLAAAKTELKRLIGSGDFGPEFHQELAEQAMAIGDWEDAVAAASRVSEAYPKAVAPLKLIALAQFNSHSYQDCLATAKKMQALDAKSADALAMKGRALVKLGSTADAEKDFESALSLQSDLPLALLGQGELEFGRGNFVAASERLSQSMESDPSLGNSSEVCYMLAQALEKKGDKESSLEYYKKSLTKGLCGPEEAEAKQALSRLQGAAGAK